MSECDNTDCIMETIELKDAKVRIKELERTMKVIRESIKWIKKTPGEGYDSIFLSDVEIALKKLEDVQE